MTWTSTGSYLLILQRKLLGIYNPKTENVSQLEVGRHVSFQAVADSHVAFGCRNGNLIIMHIDTQVKTSVSKHKSAIVCGAWTNTMDMFVSAALDHSFSISNTNNETVVQIESIGDAPRLLKWVNIDNSFELGVASLDSITLHSGLFESSAKKPLVLKFSDTYGQIVDYASAGTNSGIMVVGFSHGWLISVYITSKSDKIGRQAFQVKSFESEMHSLQVNIALDMVVTCGDNLIKIHNLQNLQVHIFD